MLSSKIESQVYRAIFIYTLELLISDHLQLIGGTVSKLIQKYQK
jgi:hypothetical protein